MTTKTETGAEGAQGTEEAGAESGQGIKFDGEFDAERAAKALEASREDAKKEKARAKELADRLAVFEKAEAEKAEAEKAAEEKLSEAKGKIAELEALIATQAIKTDFIAKATARGYQDPGLAFVAAQAQGVLGALAEDGSVGTHDFEALEKSHPLFAAEAGANGELDTGDAGRRTGGGAKTEADRFNEAIRGAF